MKPCPHCGEAIENKDICCLNCEKSLANSTNNQETRVTSSVSYKKESRSNSGSDFLEFILQTLFFLGDIYFWLFIGGVIAVVLWILGLY